MKSKTELLSEVNGKKLTVLQCSDNDTIEDCMEKLHNNYEVDKTISNVKLLLSNSDISLIECLFGATKEPQIEVSSEGYVLIYVPEEIQDEVWFVSEHWSRLSTKYRLCLLFSFIDREIEKELILLHRRMFDEVLNKTKGK